LPYVRFSAYLIYINAKKNSIKLINKKRNNLSHRYSWLQRISVYLLYNRHRFIANLRTGISLLPRASRDVAFFSPLARSVKRTTAE